MDALGTGGQEAEGGRNLGSLERGDCDHKSVNVVSLLLIRDAERVAIYRNGKPGRNMEWLIEANPAIFCLWQQDVWCVLLFFVEG